MTTNYGHFQRYFPADGEGALCFISDDNVDWFTFTRAICQWGDRGQLVSTATGETFITVDPATAIVVGANRDLSGLVPDGLYVYGVDPALVPENVIGMTFINGAFVAAPAPAPAPVITYKADIWRRTSEAQANVIDTELTKLSTRQRRLWDDAQYLDHADPMVAMMKAQMTAAFGESEANRILAPSE